MAKDELKKLKKKKDKEKSKDKAKSKDKVKEKDKVKKSKKKKEGESVQEKTRYEEPLKNLKEEKEPPSSETKKSGVKGVNSKYDFLLSMSLEEYLEQIYILSEGGDKVRVTDIATSLEISKPSVNRAINNLTDMGYVEHSNYGGIELTRKGKNIAKHIYSKHKALEAFLVERVGVSEEKAAKEAKNASHYFSIETVERMGKV